jgi:DNA-binding response OmpR family regulator
MSKKILIVDDDSALAEEMAEILRDQGYEAESVSDSVLAETKFRKENYDLYLFDYKMTGFSGVDLLLRVKEMRTETPVFIISGRPSMDKILLEHNVLHLVSAVIQKPFNIDALLAKIRDFT